MRNVFAAIALVALALVGLAVAGVRPALGGDDKVTICHATGLAGTTHFVTLTIGRPAVYGPGGHFNENGTTQAGHEQDYLGACRDETTTSTTTTGTTTTTTTTPCPDCGPGQQTNPTPPGGPRCPPGMEPTAGKDGEPGNDECRFPPSDTPPPVLTTTSPLLPPAETTTIATTPETTTAAGETTPTPSSPRPAKPVKPRSRPKPHHPRPVKPGTMPPLCPVGAPANSPSAPCAVQGAG